MGRLRNIYALAVLLTAGCFGADRTPGGSAASSPDAPEECHVAMLRNGFSIEFVRREIKGAVTRLWLGSGSGANYVELPSEQIARYEQWENAKLPEAQPPVTSPQATATAPPPVDVPVKDLIANAAARHRIDPDFMASVVKAESGFNPAAVSPKGATGLMQLMPGTAASMGVRNVLDPAANMEGGTKYLRQLLDQYGGDAVKALAAYNAGPQRVAQYGGVPPYAETRAYVSRIVEDYNRKKAQQQSKTTSAQAAK